MSRPTVKELKKIISGKSSQITALKDNIHLQDAIIASRDHDLSLANKKMNFQASEIQVLRTERDHLRRELHKLLDKNHFEVREVNRVFKRENRVDEVPRS